MQQGIQGIQGEQGPPGATEYGVSLKSADGQFIAIGGYSAARSVPQAASFSRVYFETDAEVTIRIEVGGFPSFEDTLPIGVTSRQVETIAVEPGQSIVFFVVSGEATRIWGQIDSGVAANILTLDSGVPLTLYSGEFIEL